MKVYVDLVLLLNLVIDLFLLIAVSIILRRKTSIKRLIIAALIGSLTTLALFIKLTNLTCLLIKFIISIIMVIVSFHYQNIRYTIKNLTYLYITSIILGGTLYLLNVQFFYHQEGLTFYHDGLSLNFIVIIILSPIIIYLYLKNVKELKNNYSNYYQLDIYLKDQTKISLTGFVDTGNNLKDPYTRSPIIIVNQSKVPPQEHYLLVPYQVVNHEELLKCFKPQKVIIDNQAITKKVLIGITNNDITIDGVDCIIHPELIK